jgi:hypothetical protein
VFSSHASRAFNIGDGVRASIWLCGVDVTTWATAASVGMPPFISRAGAAAWITIPRGRGTRSWAAEPQEAAVGRVGCPAVRRGPRRSDAGRLNSRDGPYPTSMVVSIRGRSAGSAPRLIRRLAAVAARPTGSVFSLLAAQAEAVRLHLLGNLSQPIDPCPLGQDHRLEHGRVVRKGAGERHHGPADQRPLEAPHGCPESSRRRCFTLTPPPAGPGRGGPSERAARSVLQAWFRAAPRSAASRRHAPSASETRGFKAAWCRGACVVRIDSATINADLPLRQPRSSGH